MEPDPAVSDFGAWLSGVLVEFPAAYTRMDHYLRQVMPDLRSIQNRTIGEDAHSLSIQFANDQGSFNVPFADLSDGEKCFMICALVLAANEVSRNLFCFWDEPDNYLALEVQQFVMDLRRAFYSGGQFEKPCRIIQRPYAASLMKTLSFCIGGAISNQRLSAV